MSIRDIIEGHINEVLNKEESLSIKRLQICKICNLSKNSIRGLICDSSKWINPKSKEVSDVKIDNWVKGCGCFLNAKTRLTHAKCIIDLW